MTRISGVRRDERGIALVMAVCIMFVLAMGLTTIIFLSSSNEQAARYSQSEQEAFSLAEAGINNAYGVLAKAAAPVTNAALLAPVRTSTYSNGSVTWSGTYSSPLWTITATGSVANPGSGGAAVTRTVKATVRVGPEPVQPLSEPAWNYAYFKSTGGACDLMLDNSTTLSTRLYLPGNLCLDNGSTVTGGPMMVGGNVTLFKSNNQIGSVDAPIPAGTAPEATAIGGLCKWFNQAAYSLCRTGAGSTGTNPRHNIWVSGLASDALISSSFPTLNAPSVDFASTYLSADPGPRQPVCTSPTAGVPILQPATFDNNSTYDPTVNGSVATPFDLAPTTTSYSCRTSGGELSWNNDTKHLTVRGTIFIDGSAFLSGAGHNPKTIDYDGQATIYLTGTMSFSNLVQLCAVRNTAVTDCDWSAWNPSDEMLIFVADGNGGQIPFGDSILMENSTHFQGGFFATSVIELQNSVEFQGPMIGETFFNGNSAQARSFPYITTLPAGAPGNPITAWTLTREAFID